MCLRKLVQLKRKYLNNKDTQTLQTINDFVINVINKDKHYYNKLSSYNFNEKTIKYLM